MSIVVTLTSIVLNSESETPLPEASTKTAASPVRTTVTKNAVLADPLAGTVKRSRRNNSISREKHAKISEIKCKNLELRRLIRYGKCTYF